MRKQWNLKAGALTGNEQRRVCGPRRLLGPLREKLNSKPALQ